MAPAPCLTRTGSRARPRSHMAQLSHDEVRAGDDPARDLFSFLEGGCRAAAERAGWDVERLRNRFVGT